MTAAAVVPTVRCPRCASEVPEGNFCGCCGCNLATQAGEASQWLRPRTFGASPSERVLRPHLLSSLFPQLPVRSRRPFLIIIGLGTMSLLGFVLLRMPAAGVAVSALGLPLLFALYLRATGLAIGAFRPLLALAVALGAVLGVAWVLVSGGLVARSYGVPMAVGLALHHLVGAGFAIPVSGMLLMAVPVVLARLLRRTPGEALDGFAIGAMGALAFSATATLTRLAPQFTAGLVVPHRPLSGLLVEALLCALTIPLTAAAAGGMVGILLWFTHPAADTAKDHPGRVRLAIALLTGLALLAHAALGVVDIIALEQFWTALAHLTMAGVVLMALRAAMQLGLLHETHDPSHAEEPILCEYCEMVVPDMAFCPACGVAARASSRRSRRGRREARPRPAENGAPPAAATAQRSYPGFAVPDSGYVAPPIRRPRFGWLLSRWGVVIMTATIVMGAMTLWLTPKIAHYMCPPDCGRPPSGTPVTALPRFTAPDFTVSYPAPGSAYLIATNDSGVTATYTGGGGGVMQLFSEPANGRSAREVVKAVIRRSYPNAQFAYEVPNAMVGYQPGYGEFADDWPQSSTAGFHRDRILAMAAVKDGVALVAFGAGPYRAFGPDFGPGPPSGANLEIAIDMGKYVNSFQWTGDPAR